MSMIRRTFKVFIIGLALACLGGCGPSELERRPSPNVIIYLVDTLRPDHLDVYGYAEPTAPNLRAFAEDAVLFERAYTPASWTKPASASLLTGLLPYKHGAVTLTNKLPEEITMIGEYLAPFSYTSAAFVGNPNVIPVWGFRQGFDHFDDVKHRTRKNDAELVVGSAIDYLSKKPSQPFLLYIHTVDPHGPYDPPKAYKRKWTEGLKGRAEVPRNLTLDTPPAIMEYTIRSYNGEIAYNDFHFGELIRKLKDHGLYEDAFIFFLSDHGEEHADHGRGGHSHTLYEELLKVPMLVKYPGSAFGGKKVSTPVSLLDVVPTLLSYIGAEIPVDLDGLDVTPLVAGERLEERPLFFDLDAQRADGSINILGGVLYRDFKLILRMHPGEDEALYYLPKDPGERENLILENEDVAGALKSRLAESRLQAKSGMLLRVLNGSDDEVRIYEGVLTTTDRFTNVEKRQFEEEDELVTGEGGRSIFFKIVSRNYKNPTRKVLPKIIDEDCVTFRVDPPDGSFTVERLTCNAISGIPLFIGREKQRVETLPASFRADAPELMVLDDSILRRTSVQNVTDLPPGGYLMAVPGGIRLDAEIDEDMAERLRALGYIK